MKSKNGIDSILDDDTFSEFEFFFNDDEVLIEDLSRACALLIFGFWLIANAFVEAFVIFTIPIWIFILCEVLFLWLLFVVYYEFVVQVLKTKRRRNLI
jgi:hypothetical protein